MTHTEKNTVVFVNFCKKALIWMCKNPQRVLYWMVSLCLYFGPISVIRSQAASFIELTATSRVAAHEICNLFLILDKL